MAINGNHVIGFAAGIATSAACFYLYKKNQSHVDTWLRQQGFNVSTHQGSNPASMSLEDLVAEKERLEDFIAEREMADKKTAPKGNI